MLLTCLLCKSHIRTSRAQQALREAVADQMAAMVKLCCCAAQGLPPHVQPDARAVPAHCTPLAAQLTIQLLHPLAQAGRRWSSCWRRQHPATEAQSALRCRCCCRHRQRSCTTRGSSEQCSRPAAAMSAALKAAAARLLQVCQCQKVAQLAHLPDPGCCTAAAAHWWVPPARIPHSVMQPRCTALLQQAGTQWLTGHELDCASSRHPMLVCKQLQPARVGHPTSRASLT